MHRLLMGILFVVGSQSAFSAPNLFEQLGTSFDKANLPTAKEAAGYWAGRCVTDTAPDKALAGIYVNKSVRVDAQFPPVRTSQSYFFDKNSSAALFDNLSPAQVERNASVAAWFAKEQWQKVGTEDNALTNYYTASDKLQLRRSLRIFYGQFENYLVLKVTRIATTDSGLVETPTTYCYFNSFRGAAGVADPVVPLPVEFGAVGPVANQWVGFANPNPTQALQWFEIKNSGRTAIDLKDLRWWDVRGTQLNTLRDYRLRSGESIRFNESGASNFTVTRLEFYVSGRTDRLELRSLAVAP